MCALHSVMLYLSVCIYLLYSTLLRACMFVVQQAYCHIFQCKYHPQVKMRPPTPIILEDLNVCFWLILCHGHNAALCVCVYCVSDIGWSDKRFSTCPMEIQRLKEKVKLSVLTGYGGPWVCEKSRLQYFLDSRLTDGDKVVSLTCWLPFAPPPLSRKIPGTPGP
jgi:hypothetical protein